MRKTFLFLCAVFFWCVAQPAGAVSFDLQGVKFGINGYADLQYNYMSELTQSDGMLMNEESTFKQEQLNLLVDAEKDRFRAHLNLQSTDTYTSEDGGKGVWKIEEAYGEYRFNDQLALKGGWVLSPFGIFNEVRYITSVYASVVLPFIYRLPEGYAGKQMVPDNSNIVAGGTYFGEKFDVNYSLFVSNGERGDDGEDKNKDKGLGGRVRFTFLDNYKIGASYYTVQDDKVNEGREHLYGIDIEATLFEKFLLQAEYVRDAYTEKLDRNSYYARLTYDMGALSPFIMYDHFNDEADDVFKNRLNRYGVGASYDVSENVILKGEYHFHKFENDDNLMPDTDKINMFRAAVIFIF